MKNEEKREEEKRRKKNEEIASTRKRGEPVDPRDNTWVQVTRVVHDLLEKLTLPVLSSWTTNTFTVDGENSPLMVTVNAEGLLLAVLVEMNANRTIRSGVDTDRWNVSNAKIESKTWNTFSVQRLRIREDRSTSYPSVLPR